MQNIFILKPTLFIKYSVTDFIFFIFGEIIIRLFKGKIFLVCLKMKYFDVNFDVNFIISGEDLCTAARLYGLYTDETL